MEGVGNIRIIVLRGFYLLTGLSLGVSVIFGFFAGSSGGDDLQTVVRAVFGAIALLALMGVLKPLKMLPILLLSLAWKSIWIGAFILPMHFDGGLDASMKVNLLAVVIGLLLTFLAIPWKFTLINYFSFKKFSCAQGS